MKLADKPNLLLHCCCGPCSTAVIEQLAEEYSISLYYYNPNITDREEYEKRKASLLKYLQAYNKNREEKEQIPFMEGPYERDVFYNCIKGLEGEAEGGSRCQKCFELRLATTAKLAKDLGQQCFTTSLSISPHKSYPLISRTGIDQSIIFKIEYLDRNFKKKAGFQRSLQLSREHGLYRQNYCGCEFSKESAR